MLLTDEGFKTKCDVTYCYTVTHDRLGWFFTSIDWFEYVFQDKTQTPVDIIEDQVKEQIKNYHNGKVNFL